MKNMVVALKRQPGILPALLAFLSLIPILSLAFDGTRLCQVLVLTLSAWLWMAWPHHDRKIRALQVILSGAVACTFLLDASVRGFIAHTYEAHPDSTMVLTALANTSRFEMREFFLTYWPRMLQWTLPLLLSASLVYLLLLRWWKDSTKVTPPNKWHRSGFAVLLILLLVALSIKPTRKYHPLIFWPTWVMQLTETRAQWDTTHLQREDLKQNAAAQMPSILPASPDTLVMVISDSVNRNHLSLHGYPRATTPNLVARLKQQPDTFKVFRYPWSADASTIAALNNFFYFGEPENPSRDHLVAIATAAGYKTWWISNHDDLAIHSQHALLADNTRMINNTPGRSATSLDDAVLPELEKALRDESRRKLIIVHLMGAHPYYRLRHPPDHAPFRKANDIVQQEMKLGGRSAWTRTLRNDYDSAIHFHDNVLDNTIKLTHRLGGNAGWIFFSDHGQEVGNGRDYAGHSATSPDGYRIPLLMWGTTVRGMPSEVQGTPIRADWLGHSVMRILGIDWRKHRPERDFLDPRYRWQPPPHPISIDYLS